MDRDFFIELKKTLIDKGMTFKELSEKLGYKSPWGLRKSIKEKSETSIDKVKFFLSQQ